MPTILNGNVAIFSGGPPSSGGSGYLVNTTIQYSCNEKYDLKGTEYRVCREEENGEVKWSGTDPQCGEKI